MIYGHPIANRLISEMIGTFALVDPSDCSCTCASAETQCREFKEIQCETDRATAICFQKEQSERHFIEVLTVGLAVLAKTPLAVVAIAGCSSHVDSNCSSSFLVIKTALKISDTSSKVSHRHGICSGRRAEISVHPVKIFSSPYFPA